MSSNSSSSGHKHPMPPRVVIVKPNSTALNYHDGISFGSNKDDDQFKDLGVVLLRNTTHISFNFNGTGVAVIAVNHSSPPIPDQYLPRWTCKINNTIPLLPTSHSSMSHNASEIIPSDNKASVCEANELPFGLHNLTIQVEVPSLPAYFHSIRYKPVNETSVQDSVLRIDARDHDAISFNTNCWDHHDDNQLQSNCSGADSAMDITFYGKSLGWVGSSKDLSHLKLTLDGQDYRLKDHHDSSNSPPSLFTVSADNLPQPYSSNLPHKFTILTNREQLTLDHLLVTFGDPARGNQMDVRIANNSSSDFTSTAIITGSVIGGIVGLVLCGIVVFLVVRCIRRRRRRNNWKDSALPPAMLYPASRVSTRSSFSRELVTGDIEYNPEAQKKLESANITNLTGITGPPAAIIIHADSGLRFPFRASEVPPYYARV